MSEREIVKLGEAEATLRLVAKLPAPDGLAERVQGRLKTAPAEARVVAWPVAGGGGWATPWMRGAAAAVLVGAVAGGAWQISMRMAPPVGGNAASSPVPAPAPARPAGSFSSAGAIHTPDTLKGPVLTHQVQHKAAKKKALAKPDTARKAAPKP